MPDNRPSRTAIAGMVVGLLVTAGAGVWWAPQANWDLLLMAVLLAFSVFSDITAVDTKSHVLISGSFLALVVAMVLLGGTPAALIGVATILAGWLRWRENVGYLLNNVLTFALFPLVGGVAFRAVAESVGLTAATPLSTC